jgi:hypothetical protein
MQKKRKQAKAWFGHTQVQEKKERKEKYSPHPKYQKQKRESYTKKGVLTQRPHTRTY